jgi:two-component system sensor kinase FixL
VLVDRVQVQQVLVNLIRNALEAMDDCPVRELRIRSDRDTTSHVRLSVFDTGTGLSEEMANRLFEAFATTKHDGMGLGLSICRTIVEAHGGRIWATVNERGGTVFHFTLPRSEAEDVAGG